MLLQHQICCRSILPEAKLRSARRRPYFMRGLGCRLWSFSIARRWRRSRRSTNTPSLRSGPIKRPERRSVRRKKHNRWMTPSIYSLSMGTVLRVSQVRVLRWNEVNDLSAAHFRETMWRSELCSDSVGAAVLRQGREWNLLAASSEDVVSRNLYHSRTETHAPINLLRYAM